MENPLSINKRASAPIIMHNNNNLNNLAAMYAKKAKEIFPKDPIGLCQRMAEEQRQAWLIASDLIHTDKPSHNGNVCSECGGVLQQAGSCSVCQNCGSTTGCG